MKNIKIGFIAGAIALTAVTSCKKLDLYRYDSIQTSEAFKTVKDAQQWDNGFYAILRGRVYGTYAITPDVQADQLNASLDYGNRNGAPHRWGDSFLNDEGGLVAAWQNYYSAIADINRAIEGFETIPTASATEVAALNKCKGDALLARAYFYHNLIIRFAKPYEPASATSDLGVPLVLKYDVSAQPSRATVKQVYDQIIADIAQAKTLLTPTTGAQGSKRFTIDVALALEARVRLHMQDWTGAYTAANTVIAGGKYPLINTAANLKAYWATDGTQETILTTNVNSTTEFPNVNNIYLTLNTTTNKWTADFIPSKWVYDFYSATDIRKSVYFEAKDAVVLSKPAPGLILVNKYPGNPALFTSATTNYAQAPKIFRVAELYLIAAEAASKAGNDANALAAINPLLVARGVGATSLAGANLYQIIKDERFRELAFEGFRLFDLKRWHEGFTRRDPQNTDLIQLGANYQTLSIPANADKFTWGMPTNDLLINPNLKPQNPGW